MHGGRNRKHGISIRQCSFISRPKHIINRSWWKEQEEKEGGGGGEGGECSSIGYPDSNQVWELTAREVREKPYQVVTITQKAE